MLLAWLDNSNIFTRENYLYRWSFEQHQGETFKVQWNTTILKKSKTMAPIKIGKVAAGVFGLAGGAAAMETLKHYNVIHNVPEGG